MELSDLAIGLGLLLLAEGLPLFASPGRYRRLLKQIDTVPDGTLRVSGLVSMGVGLAILYALK